MGEAATVWVEGLVFGEGPRWHDGSLWFSDIHAHRVHRVRDGVDEVVAEIDDRASGLGWLADGSTIVVAMESGRVLRIDPVSGDPSVHAEVSHLARGTINDMIVRSDGTAYVGDMGARTFSEHPDHSIPGQLFLIAPDGVVSVARDELRAPNGMILTDDERTLILAESGGLRLLAFPVAVDGTLGAERVFADLVPDRADVPVAAPDGICLDADGAVWVADPVGARVLRVLEGGEVTDVHRFEGLTPVACVLGGDDRRTLFVCAAEGWRYQDVGHRRSGRVLALPVDVPGAGKP